MCTQFDLREWWAGINAYTAQIAVQLQMHARVRRPTARMAQFPSPHPSQAAKLQRLGTPGVDYLAMRKLLYPGCTMRRLVFIAPSLIILSGTIKLTPSEWLSVLSNILSSHLGRQLVLKGEWQKGKANQLLPIHKDCHNQILRLKSQNWSWKLG